MFVIPTQKVGFTHRVVAMLVACAVVLLSIGVYQTAQAANLTDVSNTLTDSGPGVTSGHDIRFSIPDGSSHADDEEIFITFPSGFTNVANATSGSLVVTVNGGGPVAITNFSSVGQVISFDGVTAGSEDDIRVVIADGIITNPVGSNQSYEFYITTQDDTGRTRVAIVDYVTVTAVVESTFDFVVSGLNDGVGINGTTTTGTTSADQIAFGVLDANVIYTMAQELSVTTNAINGFVVTVQQDGNLQSTTGADIDGFIDGTYTNTPVDWQAPLAQILDENTWGHWGLTSDDSTLNGGEFTNAGGDKWVAASTTPRQIFAHNGPADGTTQDYGLAKVGYQIQITPFQEAADDYITTLMYIATPTF